MKNCKNFTVIFIMTVLVVVYGSLVINSTEVSAKYIYKKGFSYSEISKSISKRIEGNSYRKNKYIGLTDLRYLRVRYINYNGDEKDGEMIVNKKIAKDVVQIFYELYKIKYPIHRMKLVDEYDSDDNNSMENDNTSCFNYRPTSETSSNLSMHALGLAIDINPRINPCVGGTHGLLPYNSKLYKNRSAEKCRGKYAKMMIHKNDKAYKIFNKHGFCWGGEWKSMKDYQHFYKIISDKDMKLKYEW